MTAFNVLDTRRNSVGTYPEYPKFARYSAETAGVIWVPLLVSENRVRFFALSTLEEVEAVAKVTPVAVKSSERETIVMEVTQEPLTEWELRQKDNAAAGAWIENTRNDALYMDRWMYVEDLNEQIETALKDPHLEFQFKPVLLALANYVLYLEMSKVDPRKAQQSAKKIVSAECANVTEGKKVA